VARNFHRLVDSFFDDWFRLSDLLDWLIWTGAPSESEADNDRQRDGSRHNP
jgi:hypothetical protein